MNVFVDRWWPATEIPGQVGEASGAWEHQLQPESAGQQDEDCPEMAAAEPDDQGPALGKKIFDIRHSLKWTCVWKNFIQSMWWNYSVKVHINEN